MPSASFLMSFLQARLATRGAEFATRHPGAWLVWEPGAWQAPPASLLTRTMQAKSQATTPQNGDSLCLSLGVEADKVRAVKVGRESTNDVVINDGTVSRHHFTLSVTPEGAWSVEPASGRTLVVDGFNLAGGERHNLRSGASIVAGGVTLTLYDSAGFVARLKKQQS